MNRKLYKWMMCAGLAVLLMWILATPTSKALAAEGEPPLIITEIVNKSDGNGQPYEYVEIFNNTSQTINLENYQLQYFTSSMTNPANEWPITSKTIKAKDTLVLWLKKFDYPNVPLWDFNSNYEVLLKKENVFEVGLTTSGQGLHDSSLRQVGIAGPDGIAISTALINEGGADGITNKSIVYQASESVEVTKVRSNEVATPGELISGQVPGPDAPTELKATPMNQAIALNWEPAEGAAAYNVYASASTEPIHVPVDTSYTAEGLTNDQAYTFKVTSIDVDGNESAGSSEVTVTPQEVVDTQSPIAPAGLKSTPGADHVTLKWDENNEGDLAGYRIYINGTIYDTSETNSITISPLDLGRDYTFEVTALDHVGNESPKSALVAGPKENAPVPSLLITEVVPNSDNYAGYDAFEYLEVYNNSGETIDLKGYHITSGGWDVEIADSLTIDPWGTQLFWTRVEEIQPMTLEAFNHNYFSSYKNKYLNEEDLKILEDIGGLVNGGRSVTIFDPQGLEVVNATYTGGDVSVENAVTFGYPKDGSLTMEKLAGHQPTTPGWLVADQAPARPILHEEPPQTPANILADAGNGEVSLTWDPNPESDIYRYHIYKDGVLEFSVPPSEQEFTLSLLMGNKDYVLEMAAEDTSGNVSLKSAPLTVTPSHQIITQEERSSHGMDPDYQGLWDISKDGPVIPGLFQDLVPQGMTYYKQKDWLLTVNYLDDGRPGTLTIVDATTEKLVKSVLLYNTDGSPYTGHAGGITVSRDHVWIASEQFLFQLKVGDLVSAENNAELQFVNQIPVPVEAAYTVYDEGILWVGEFYQSSAYPTDPSHHQENRNGETQYAWMIGYDLERNNDMLSSEHWNGDPNKNTIPDYVLSTTGKVQGAIVNKAGVTLSTSYGRANDSVLYRYEHPLKENPHDSVTIDGKEVPLWFLDGATSKPKESIEAIPMPEGIVEVQKELYVVFESGANKYRYTTTYPMDRMLKIDMKVLMKDDKEIIKDDRQDE
ncbi:lamin tail domain-containing protein [Virgibacillus sp. DJP39]|uniref:lamin tail domain-containing protein n=1 Tax=Virgibacillus sp. DJP39 TaxID=3409790 RepID=UPI003BB4E1A3